MNATDVVASPLIPQSSACPNTSLPDQRTHNVTRNQPPSQHAGAGRARQHVSAGTDAGWPAATSANAAEPACGHRTTLYWSPRSGGARLVNQGEQTDGGICVRGAVETSRPPNLSIAPLFCTPFSGQFRRQCMHFGNSADNFGGLAAVRA